MLLLQPLTRIGRAQAQVPQDIVLRGLGIANEHCVVEIEDKNVFITSLGGARYVQHAATSSLQPRLPYIHLMNYYSF